MTNKVKVLHVLGGLYCGGTETFIMNMFRSIDRDKVDFDFLIHEQSKAHFDDEVLSLGGKIYRIPDRTEVGTLRYIRILIQTLHKIKPDIVHGHAMFNAGIVMIASYFAGIKKRVCHAHSSGDQKADSIKRKMFRVFMSTLIKIFSTEQAACSEMASEYLYGKKALKNEKVKLINNGIDIHKFLSVKQTETMLIRKELDLRKDSLVIGLVGRLVDVKNPLFIIYLLERILKINQNTIVVFVGEGPLMIDIKKIIKEKHLAENVRLIGNRTDIPILMSAFDIFLLPSNFEGAPIVAFEAQAQGLPCLVSDKVPQAIDLGLGLVKYLSLNNEEQWIEAIASPQKKEKDIEKIKVAFIKKGYDQQSAAHKLLQIYGVC